MYNTPPTYAIYIAGLVFEWLQAQGGVAAMERAQHREGARCCTTRIDDSGGFYAQPGRAATAARA